MDAVQQRHLKISRALGSDENERSLLVQVSLDGELLHERLTLHEPFSSSEREDLRWYLEQYASQEPFHSDKAHTIAFSISTYSKELRRQLQLDTVFQKRDPLVDEDHSLVIDVCEGPAQHHGLRVSLHSLHWELLEQLELWSGLFSRVTTIETLNILVVIARSTENNPAAYQDVRPFAALDVLLRMRESLQQHPGTLQLRVEVVRPGTLDALKRQLRASTDTHGTGFYHFIHLDMHGRVAKRRLANGDTVTTAWLDFASPGLASKTKPVPADSVSKLLVDHGIHCAILNACESARADQGLRANLAATFLEKGVGSVLAMSYRFPGSVIDSFFSTFYHGIFFRGLSMSAAAAEARRHLREHGLRKSRFGLELQVQDWFIPVFYLCRQDLLLCSNRPADPPTTYAAKTTTPRDKAIVGRDFDLLRLEEAVSDANLVLVHGPAGVGKSVFVKFALDLWRGTQYFDKFSMVDLLPYVAYQEATGEKIISRIAQDLEVPDSFLVAGTPGTPGTDVADPDPLQAWSRALVVLDRIDLVFNRLFNLGQRPVAEAVASFLRQITSSEFADKTGKRVTVILISTLGKDWWEARCPPPLVTPQYFELDALELSAAVNLAESLLQRIPLALKLALPAATSTKPSLEDAFKAIHVGHVNIDFDALMHTADYALVSAVKFVYEHFLQCQDTLCSLADFWVEGPLDLPAYLRSLAADSGLSRVGDMSPMIDALNELGIWRVSNEGNVEWLHPVFTLYIRQRRRTHAYHGAGLLAKGIMRVADFLSLRTREHPFGSTASLQTDIPRHFVRAVGHRGMAELMVDVLMGLMRVSECDVPQSMQRMRASFFNMLAVLDMICRDESLIPLELWPRDFINTFLSASRLALAPSELEMLTGYAEATLSTFQQRIGGIAVQPEFQGFAFNLVVHLFISSLFSGIINLDAAEQSVIRALAIVEASEAKYGPMTGDKLMWKAMTYRCQAVILLLRQDEAGAEAAWEHMKSIELEYFGPSAFQPSSTFDSSSPDPGVEQPPESSTARELLSSGPRSKLHNSTAAWVPVRHAAWPWLKEQVLRRGNTQALNRLYFPGLDSAFENMVDSYRREGGWTGLGRWQRYFPPHNDFERYTRSVMAEDPKKLLARLEDGLSRGDWKIAARVHQSLAKKAAAEMRLDQAVFQVEQLGEIIEGVSPDREMAQRASMGRDMLKPLLRAMKRGYILPEECLEFVCAFEAMGMDFMADHRALGIPERVAKAISQGAARAENDRARLFEDPDGDAGLETGWRPS